MSDYETVSVVEKKLFDRILENPFFSLSKPYLDFLAKGVIFNLVYFIMAGFNLILPFVIFAKAIDAGTGIFQSLQYNNWGNFTIAFIFAWLVIAFACWIGFQLWLERRKRIAAIIESTEFIATVIFAEILQTFGEWLGTLLIILGIGVGPIVLIVLGKNGKRLDELLEIFGFMPVRAMIVLGAPVAGFLIIMASRFFAEQVRMLASLVNNTQKIAANIQQNQFADRLRVWASLVNSVKEVAATLRKASE